MMTDFLGRISPLNIWRFLAAKFGSFYSFILQKLGLRPIPILLPKLTFFGSTANFFRLRRGVVLKSPTTIGVDQIPRLDPTVERNFDVEKRIFEYLGPDPHIIKYLGWESLPPTGLLFKEANGGSLQSLLDNRSDDITIAQRQKWCQQAVECAAYIHSRGIVHNDLRPDNFLVHDLNLLLCDFGGANCDAIGARGEGISGPGFFSPRLGWQSSTEMDVFGLGSVLYIIMTGYWPYRSSRERMYDLEMDAYEELTNKNFGEGQFPHVSDALWDRVIQACWTGIFGNAQEVAEFVKHI